jgi:type I restriction-modification system DNA methylase subunit
VHPVESSQGPGLVPSTDDICSRGYEKSGSWLSWKKLMAMRPKIKFSGKNKAMDFEEFMGKMEKAMNQEGVMDDVRVSELKEWFIGKALEVVQAVKRSQVEGGAEVVLRKVKEELLGYFGTQEFKTGERLKELMKGGPIGKGDHGSIRV